MGKYTHILLIVSILLIPMFIYAYPEITLSSPDNHSFTSILNISFTLTVLDNVTNTTYCNLTINGVVNQTNITIYNNTASTIYPSSNLTFGTYDWNVSCWNNDSRVNTSGTRMFTIENCYPPENGDWNISDENVTCTERNIPVNGSIFLTNGSIVIINRTNLIFQTDWDLNLTDTSRVSIINSTIETGGNDGDILLYNKTNLLIVNTSGDGVSPSNLDLYLYQNSSGTVDFFYFTRNFDIKLYNDSNVTVSNSTLDDLFQQGNAISNIVDSSITTLSIILEKLSTLNITGISPGIINRSIQSSSTPYAIFLNNTNINYYSFIIKENAGLNISHSSLYSLYMYSNQTVKAYNISTEIVYAAYYASALLEKTVQTNRYIFALSNSILSFIDSRLDDWLVIGYNASITFTNTTFEGAIDYGGSLDSSHANIYGNITFNVTGDINFDDNGSLTRHYPTLISNQTYSTKYASTLQVKNGNEILWNGTASNGYANINLTFNQSNYNLTYNITLPNNKTIASINLTTTTPINITFNENPPIITINAPITNLNTSLNNITFNFTSTDDFFTEITCNLTINSTTHRANQNFTTGSTNMAYPLTNLTDGLYLWNITCWDTDDYINTSITRTFTVDTISLSFAPNITASDEDADGNVNLSWIATPNTWKYGIFRHTINFTNISLATRLTNTSLTYFTDNTTDHGTTYWYLATSIDYAGNENISIHNHTIGNNNATANDTIFPKLPTDINVTNASNVATIRWPSILHDISDNVDVEGLTYEIWYKTGGIINTSQNLTDNGFTEIPNTDTTTNMTTYSIGASGRYMFYITTRDDANLRNLSRNLSTSDSNLANVTLSYTAPSQDSNNDDSGGSSGGGTANIPAKLNKHSRGWAEVDADIEETINKALIPIIKAYIDIKESARNVQFSIESFEKRPENLMDTKYLAYKFMKITLTSWDEDPFGTHKLELVLPSSWTQDHGITKDNIALYRFNEGKWTKLPTKYLKTLSETLHYEATVEGFSYFAIASTVKTVEPVIQQLTTTTIDGQTTETTLQVPQQAQTDNPDTDTDQDEKKEGSFNIWLILIPVMIIILIGAGVFFFLLYKNSDSSKIDSLLNDEKTGPPSTPQVEVPSQLLDYVKYEKAMGATSDVLRQRLLTKGWQKAQVDKVIIMVEKMKL